MHMVGHTKDYWDKLNGLLMNRPDSGEQVSELIEQARLLPTLRERLRALESLLFRAGRYELFIIQELLEINSLTTRRRAELTLQLAELLGPMRSELYWAERVSVAQDALALAQKLRDRKMIRRARKLFRQHRSGYSPKRKDKSLSRW